MRECLDDVQSANICVMTCNCSASSKGGTEGNVDKNLHAIDHKIDHLKIFNSKKSMENSLINTRNLMKETMK